MSPYEILGIRPTASRNEAEAAYRALLRECHPDLHLGAGPEALARAEQNAPAQRGHSHHPHRGPRLRRGLRRAVRPEPRFPLHGGQRLVRPSEPTQVHDQLRDVRTPDRRAIRVPRALLLDHVFAERVRKHQRRIARPPRLTLIPAPMFWALMLLMFYWACVFSIFGDSSAALAGWWLGILAFLIFLPFAYKAERYRRRF